MLAMHLDLIDWVKILFVAGGVVFALMLVWIFWDWEKRREDKQDEDERNNWE